MRTLKPDLLSFLETVFCCSIDRSSKITSVKERPLNESRTHPISRLHLTFANGRELNLIFKQLCSQPSKDASREVLAYQSLLTEGGLGAPKVYGSICNPEQKRYWLLLEDVGSQRLDHCGLAERIEAIRWAARMHGGYQNRQTELSRFTWLDKHGTGFYLTLANAARSRICSINHQQILDDFDQLMISFQTIIDYLKEQPQTLIHGDLSDHNLFIETGRTLSIRVIDWEWIAMGVGAWDLTKLLPSNPEIKEKLKRIYCEEFTRQTGITVDQARLETTLHYCQILRVLWKIGCPSPPPSGVTWDETGIQRLLNEMRQLQAFNP